MIEEELTRISNMDEHQILLKARNHKFYKNQNLRDFQRIGSAIDERLKTFGYRIEPACCGRYNIIKTNGDVINVARPIEKQS